MVAASEFHESVMLEIDYGIIDQLLIEYASASASATFFFSAVGPAPFHCRKISWKYLLRL
jgi:hypothetical protein